jgi:uncharacterized protein
MIKLFTDGDLDGVGCGLLAKLAFGDEVSISYCSYRNLDERVEQFMNNDEYRDASIFITDLAVNQEVEQKLAERYQQGKHIQVVDHHITALRFNQYPWGLVKPIDDTGKKTSATSLFYQYLLEQGKLEANQALEQFVELVRQYDTWEWEENENMDAKRLNDLFSIIGLDEFVKEMFERLQTQSSFSLTEIENIIIDVEEKKMSRYIRQKNRQLVQTFIEGYCVGIVYAERYISELGNALSKLNPHLDLIAMVNLGTKHIGFRTIHDTVDVSEFAQRFGGGGHTKASGCFVNETTFPLFVVNTFKLKPVYHDAEQNKLNIKQQEPCTFYKNQNNEWFIIFARENSDWIVSYQNEYKSFGSFEEAERFIKRNYAAGLAFDHEVVEYLSGALEMEQESVQQKYHQVCFQFKEKTLSKKILRM